MTKLKSVIAVVSGRGCSSSDVDSSSSSFTPTPAFHPYNHHGLYFTSTRHPSNSVHSHYGTSRMELFSLAYRIWAMFTLATFTLLAYPPPDLNWSLLGLVEHGAGAKLLDSVFSGAVLGIDAARSVVEFGSSLAGLSPIRLPNIFEPVQGGQATSTGHSSTILVSDYFEEIDDSLQDPQDGLNSNKQTSDTPSNPQKGSDTQAQNRSLPHSGFKDTFRGDFHQTTSPDRPMEPFVGPAFFIILCLFAASLSVAAFCLILIPSPCAVCEKKSARLVCPHVAVAAASASRASGPARPRANNARTPLEREARQRTSPLATTPKPRKVARKPTPRVTVPPRGGLPLALRLNAQALPITPSNFPGSLPTGDEPFEVLQSEEDTHEANMLTPRPAQSSAIDLVYAQTATAYYNRGGPSTTAGAPSSATAAAQSVNLVAVLEEAPNVDKY